MLSNKSFSNCRGIKHSIILQSAGDIGTTSNFAGPSRKYFSRQDSWRGQPYVCIGDIVRHIQTSFPFSEHSSVFLKCRTIFRARREVLSFAGIILHIENLLDRVVLISYVFVTWRPKHPSCVAACLGNDKMAAGPGVFFKNRPQADAAHICRWLNTRIVTQSRHYIETGSQMENVRLVVPSRPRRRNYSYEPSGDAPSPRRDRK